MRGLVENVDRLLRHRMSVALLILRGRQIEAIALYSGAEDAANHFLAGDVVIIGMIAVKAAILLFISIKIRGLMDLRIVHRMRPLQFQQTVSEGSILDPHQAQIFLYPQPAPLNFGRTVSGLDSAATFARLRWTADWIARDLPAGN